MRDAVAAARVEPLLAGRCVVFTVAGLTYEAVVGPRLSVDYFDARGFRGPEEELTPGTRFGDLDAAIVTRARETLDSPAIACYNMSVSQ